MSNIMENLFLKYLKMIETKTNVKITDFLDDSRYSKAKAHLPNINKSSNHPSHLPKTLAKSINERLSKNLSNQNIFDTDK